MAVTANLVLSLAADRTLHAHDISDDSETGQGKLVFRRRLPASLEPLWVELSRALPRAAVGRRRRSRRCCVANRSRPASATRASAPPVSHAHAQRSSILKSRTIDAPPVPRVREPRARRRHRGAPSTWVAPGRVLSSALRSPLSCASLRRRAPTRRRRARRIPKRRPRLRPRRWGARWQLRRAATALRRSRGLIWMQRCSHATRTCLGCSQIRRRRSSFATYSPSRTRSALTPPR